MGQKFDPLSKTIDELRVVREFWFDKWQHAPWVWKAYCWDKFQYASSLVRKKWANEAY